MLHSEEQKRQMAFSTGTTKGFLDINKPLFNKPLKDLMKIAKDASDIIDVAGGVHKMKPDNVFKLGKAVQDVTNELASRN